MKKIRTTQKGTYTRYAVMSVGFVALFGLSVYFLGLDIHKFIARFANLPEVVGRMMQMDLSIIWEVLSEVLVSLSLAFCSLVIGALLSFVLAALAADNLTFNRYLAGFIKGLVAVIRAIPALVWILMIVASIGFGNTGGMIGLIFPTVGYLTKSFAASLEEDGLNRVEALKAVGARWLDIVLKGVSLSVLPSLLSWIAMRFENNIAEGISLGMVGVGGVGYLLNKAIQKFDYASISTIIVIIFLTMFIIELLTVQVKKRIRAH